MRVTPLIVVLLIFIAGCASLPDIKPDLDSVQTGNSARCNGRLPHGRWQFYHAIEATVPGGKKTGLTGVSVISPAERIIDCALMTLEGFVLFRGRYDGSVTVHQAVAPFDRPAFAQGLMNDLLLLFFRPASPLQLSGRLENGDRVCRYADSEHTIDIILTGDDSWRLNQYTASNRILRTISGHGRSTPTPSHISIKRHGIVGYTLKLRLVDFVSLDAS